MKNRQRHQALTAIALFAGLLLAAPAFGQHPGSTSTHISHIANENIDCGSVPPWAPHPPGCGGHGTGPGGDLPDDRPKPPLPPRPPHPMLPASGPARPLVPPSIGWLFPRWFLLPQSFLTGWSG